MTTVISPSAASSSTLTTASMQPTSPGMFLKAYNIPTCYILRRKKWSSQWRQFMQLRKEAWKKFRTSRGFEPVTSRYRCNALTTELLTLGAGQLWVHMFPWKKWVLMIYEINHIFNSNWPTPNVSGFIAQLVEHRTSIARSLVQTPLNSWIFFSGFFTKLHKLRSLRRSFLHSHFISALRFIYDLFHISLTYHILQH